jgi:hypothetical protein
MFIHRYISVFMSSYGTFKATLSGSAIVSWLCEIIVCFMFCSIWLELCINLTLVLLQTEHE